MAEPTTRDRQRTVTTPEPLLPAHPHIHSGPPQCPGLHGQETTSTSTRVETTARGDAQTELVRDYIANTVLRG